MRKNHIAISLIVLASGTAAAAKPPPAPTQYVDEAELVLYLINRGEEGYWFRIATWVYGVTSSSDSVRLDWSQKGKVLASQKCPLDVDGDTAKLECTYEGTPLRAVGTVTADLIYRDDQTDKEYLLRTFEVKVAAVPWLKSTSWQIVHDDNLGTAFVWHRMTGDENQRGDYELVFYFWVARSGGEQAQLRCTVNGKAIPDFKTSIATGKYTIEADYNSKGDERRYRWVPTQVIPEQLWFGTRAEVLEHLKRDDLGDNGRALGDLPGDWACALRSDGNVVRQFQFKVNAQGRIEPLAGQSAPGFPKLLPGVVLVDMRLPAKNGYDLRVDPEAMRKSMRYGMPWPNHPDFDAMRKALPPASGFGDPGAK